MPDDDTREFTDAEMAELRHAVGYRVPLTYFPAAVLLDPEPIEPFVVPTLNRPSTLRGRAIPPRQGDDHA